MVREWNLLRTIACLSVVFLHSSTQIGRSFGYPSIENMYFLRVLLTYATPTFIVLSEIILANRYKDKIPPNFFTKRIKLITIHCFCYYRCISSELYVGKWYKHLS